MDDNNSSDKEASIPQGIPVPADSHPIQKLAPIGQLNEASTAEESKIDGGTYIEEGLDNKYYMIKSSGTIIDVTRSADSKKKSRKIPMSVRKPTSSTIFLLSSQFRGRDPVLFFPYPSYIGSKKPTADRVPILAQEDLGPKKASFKISETTNIYNAIVNSCKNAGLHLVDEDVMLAKKRVNEGKLDIKEFNQIFQITETGPPESFQYNLLFTGAVKEDLLRKIRDN